MKKFISSVVYETGIEEIIDDCINLIYKRTFEHGPFLIINRSCDKDSFIILDRIKEIRMSF